MFDLNWQPILWAIMALIQIKDVLYQQAIHQKYDRHGDETPSGYGPFRPHIYSPDLCYSPVIFQIFPQICLYR